MAKKLKGEEAARQAYRDLLGREPESEQAVANWAKLGSYDRIARQMSLSDEARARGVDPGAYGNKAVDPSTLKGEKREFYDAWAERNGGTFYSGHEELLDWHRGFGSADVLRARLDGTIQTGRNGEIVVTQAAVDRYGAENLNFSGSSPGDIIVVPQGSGVKVSNRAKDPRKYKEGGTLSDEWAQLGYESYMAKGNKTKGLGQHLSDWTGVSEKWTVPLTNIALNAGSPLAMAGEVALAAGAKEGAFVADPLGMTSGAAGGSDRYEINVKSGADLTGLREEELAKGQGYAQAALTIAAGTVNPLLAAAVQAGAGANRAFAGRQEWGDVAVQTAVSTALAAFGSPNVYVNAFQQAAGASAVSLYRGGSASEAFESAAWAAGGNLAGAAVGDFAAAGGASAVKSGAAYAFTDAAMQKLRGGEVDFAQAALSGAQGAAVGGKMAEGEKTTGTLKLGARLENTFGTGRGGKIPGGSVKPFIVKRWQDRAAAKKVKAPAAFNASRDFFKRFDESAQGMPFRARQDFVTL